MRRDSTYRRATMNRAFQNLFHTFSHTFAILQGQSRALTSQSNLEISDEDNLADVKVSVVTKPRHGTLNLNGKEYFTPADLDAGNVVYQHDGGNSYR